MQAVNARMKNLNPGFEELERKDAPPKGEHPRGFGLNFPARSVEYKVMRIAFCSDNVRDLSPLAALTDLANLTCEGSKPGQGKLSDLRPLKDLKLTRLNINCNEVRDLTPLRGMSETLTHLSCRSTQVRDFTPLKELSHLVELECDPPTTQDDLEILVFLPNLTKVNGQAKRDFLKTMPATLPKKAS
jgi:hypothetical protein